MADITIGYDLNAGAIHKCVNDNDRLRSTFIIDDHMATFTELKEDGASLIRLNIIMRQREHQT